MSTPDSDFPFTVDLGSNGGLHVFNSTEDIKVWLKREIDAWTWFRDLSMNPQSRVKIYQNTLRTLWEQVSQQIQTLEQNIAQGQTVIQALTTVKQLISHNFSNYLLHSESAAGKFVLARKESPERAAYIYSFLKRAVYPQIRAEQHYQELTTVVLDAYLETALYEKGLTRDSNTAEEALNAARSRWESQLAVLFQNTRKNYDDHKTDFENLRKSIHVDKAEYKLQFDKLLKEQNDAGSGHNTEAKKQYDAIIDQFKTEMALKAPVTYWSRKACAHRALTLLPIGILFLAAWVLTLLYPSLDLKALQLKLLPTDPHGYGNLLIIGVGFTLIIWFLRILVRIFLSQIHLATEAAEKKVIVQTFLALLAEKAIENKDKELILAAIFRPSSTGIIKEDGGPATFWELLGKIVGGGK